MNNVISSDTFTRKRLEREYASLMSSYFSHPYAKLPNPSIQYICDSYNIKAKMSVYLPGAGIVDSYFINSAEEINIQLQDLEFDYDWLGNQILRLCLGCNSVTTVNMDIYFHEDLSSSDIEKITELLERDVIDNYAIIDDNMFELTLIQDKIDEVSEEYLHRFGKEIGR